MTIKLVNIIFGMKVHQARSEANLTLSQFAAQCELSPSYVTEIEKGRKYPRADKIMRMAEVLGKSYDDLVSIKLASSLSYLESTLSSSIFRRFPFEEFGLGSDDLATLLTREPDKASALLHAVLEIGRRYDLKEEEFLRAALRSYQEIHENYFQDLEDAALTFTAEIGVKNGLTGQPPADLDVLKTILYQEYGCHVDQTRMADDPNLMKYRAVFVRGRRPTLFVNPTLRPHQVKFVLARELGYQYLGLKERSLASTPIRIDSFQQILNDFRAAYFGGALLMPRQSMVSDLQALFDQTTWNPLALLAMLDKYDITPEMLFYRFSELIPEFYGIKLHFLRCHQVGDDFRLVKQLNMNQLIVPSGIGLFEHFCRRWLSVKLLQDMPTDDEVDIFETPFVGIQLSEFVDTRDRFLCLGIARPLVLSPDVNSSVIVGFRVDAELKNAIQFVEDPAIPKVYINETCERCSLTAAQCQERAAEPTILQAQQDATARRLALSQLEAQLPD